MSTRDPITKVAKLEAELAKAREAAARKELRESNAAYKRLASAHSAVAKVAEINDLDGEYKRQCDAFLRTLRTLMDEMASTKAKQGEGAA